MGLPLNSLDVSSHHKERASSKHQRRLEEEKEIAPFQFQGNDKRREKEFFEDVLDFEDDDLISEEL